MADAELKQLLEELHEWEGTLDKRKAQRSREQKRKRKLSKALAAIKRALHTTNESVARARHAIKKKKGRIAAKKGGSAQALAWCRANLFVTESPPGSNAGGRITTWEQRLANGGSWLVGQPWCGTFVANALLAANVKGVTSRLASVSLIEDDARAGRGPFTSWGWASSAKPGDLVVLFGRGVHVEMVREVHSGFLLTYGGNTSSGTTGSQSNGGGSFPRSRPFSDVHGIAHVRYS